ncbi:MAG: hypothetical protein ACJASM_003192 [Salibacteraceae bacterium]|jgi:hypothetical protein
MGLTDTDNPIVTTINFFMLHHALLLLESLHNPELAHDFMRQRITVKFIKHLIDRRNITV